MNSFLVYSALIATATSLLSICTPALANVPPGKASNAREKITSSPSSRLQQWVERAWQIIDENYVDPNFSGLNWQQIREAIQSHRYTSSEDAYAAIRAILGQLNDPATRLLTPQQFAGFEREVTGQPHIGVGLPELLSLDIDEQTRKLTVVTPAPNTPAAEAGLRPNDRVLRINGISTHGMDLGDAAMRLRGSAGSTVQLTIQRNNSVFDVILSRREITPIPAVKARLEAVWQGRQVGYIILNQFTASSPQQLKTALEHIQNADGFVLDLRNNPGGSVSALQEIAGFFLGESTIGISVERSGTTELRSIGLQLTDKPLVVLVNEGTASAAEFLAGALLEAKRATVVGTPTFGKGIVHNFLPLADGAVVAVTTGQVRTPSGHPILGSGIIPNVRVDMENSPLLDSTIVFASWSDIQYRHAIEQLIMRTEGNSPAATIRGRTTALQRTD
ncbi:S41 family peptidase [Leptolyngbya sp. FACHB-261]|uniref:S41 family peptidase n=1 Tax=Leptolyngbya sp. FACHB-261 TaxID=2692806 RepID=UPI001689FE58|nr:S41 family peptidase [Leptolyngbya sp. FACHB-261]MBD2102502.1 S41 family peptidase [Leptolyngbya sp. FACHB-261]